MGYRILYILAVFIGPYMTVKSSMEYRRYLQCTDGLPEPDRTSCIERVIVKETRDFHAKHNGSY